MIRPNPEARISARGALEYFETLVQEKLAVARRWRVKGLHENPIPAFVADVASAAAEVGYQINKAIGKSVPGISASSTPEL
jgi:hypothetical protein